VAAPAPASDYDSSTAASTSAGQRNRILIAVPPVGRHSLCLSSTRVVLASLNVRSINNKVDAVRDLFNNHGIDVLCLSET